MNPGFFGKIGAAGDFVSRGWSVDLRSALDGLFQHTLLDMQQRGADLHALVETAPPVSLCIRPGVLFEGGLCGIVCLSQDRVGRVFPLTMGWQTDAASAAPLHWLPERVNVALLSAYYQAQDGRFGPDELLGAIRRVDAGALANAADTALFAASEETLPRIGADADHCWLAGNARSVPSAFGSLLATLAGHAGMLGGTLDDQAAYTGFFVSRSFPPPPLLAAWFDRDWAAQPWKVLAPQATSDAVAQHDDEDGTRPPRWSIDTAPDATDS